MDDQPKNQPQSSNDNPGDQPSVAESPSQDSAPMDSPTPAPVATPLDSSHMIPEHTPLQNKRKKLLVIIAAVLATILVGSAVLAYNFWYQNPDKVVGDAMMNVLKARNMTFSGLVETDGETTGKVRLSGAFTDTGTGQLDVSLEFKSEGSTTAGQVFKVEGAGVMDDKGDLYFKVKNFDEVINQQMGTEGATPERKKLLDDFVAKVNDKWVKISSDTLRTISDSAAKTQECIQQAVKTMKEDSSLSSEVSDLYKKHTFIEVKEKLGSQGNSLGYVLEGNEATAKEFVAGLKETKVYKTLSECDKTFTIDEKDLTASSESSDNTRVELWVDRWSHQVTKFTVDSTDKQTSEKSRFIFQPKFNQDVSIETPKDSISPETVMNAFTEFQMEVMKLEYGDPMQASDAPLLTPSV